MDVAVLGLGEAGGRIAADLVAAGCTVRGWDPARRRRRDRQRRKRSDCRSRRRCRPQPQLGGCCARCGGPRRRSARRRHALRGSEHRLAPAQAGARGGAAGAVRGRRPRRGGAELGPGDTRARVWSRRRALRGALPAARDAGRRGRPASGRRRRPEAAAQRLHEGHGGRRDREPRGGTCRRRRGPCPRRPRRRHRRAAPRAAALGIAAPRRPAR